MKNTKLEILVISSFLTRATLTDEIVYCLNLKNQQVHLAERMQKDDQIFHRLG